MVPVLRIIPPLLSFLTISSLSCGGREGEVADPSDSSDTPAAADTMTASGEGTELRFMSAGHIFIPSGGMQSDSLAAPAGADARATAEAVRERIVSGRSSFEDMALQYSGETGAVLPLFTMGALAWPLDSAVAALGPEEVSGVVGTRFGFHILKRLDL
ncbi:MAG: hypothetical protein AVO35_13065 [Candidatus Aegiribacteria sp. MLS_C]|nr:MAG: hypothetical protein AVO35_13065 [Candidatus Aegiribacteria sp. MLS_C]